MQLSLHLTVWPIYCYFCLHGTEIWFVNKLLPKWSGRSSSGCGLRTSVKNWLETPKLSQYKAWLRSFMDAFYWEQSRRNNRTFDVVVWANISIEDDIYVSVNIFVIKTVPTSPREVGSRQLSNLTEMYLLIMDLFISTRTYKYVLDLVFLDHIFFLLHFLARTFSKQIKHKLSKAFLSPETIHIHFIQHMHIKGTN